MLVGLGAVLAAMNTMFYLAIERLPLATVGAIEFLGTIVLAATGHRIAGATRGIDRLGAAMLVAAVLATPFGIGAAAGAFGQPGWLLAGVGVGICSSVIPYITDQLAMARLRRATFALKMLSILPAAAMMIGIVVLTQLPTARDLAGVALVIAGVAVHQQRAD